MIVTNSGLAFVSGLKLIPTELSWVREIQNLSLSMPITLRLLGFFYQTRISFQR